MKPLSRLEPLTEPQLAQVAAWLKDHTYKEVAESAKEQFGLEIPRMTLARFRGRLLVTEMLDDSTESSAATAELIHHAATGQDHFTPATMNVLEQTAFNLALTCMKSDDDMTAFRHVSAITCRYRNTAVRERIAAVQEKKNLIREKELQFKAARRDPSAAPSPTPLPGESSSIATTQPEPSDYSQAA